jgi:hypothetical protein
MATQSGKSFVPAPSTLRTFFDVSFDLGLCLGAPGFSFVWFASVFADLHLTPRVLWGLRIGLFLVSAVLWTTVLVRILKRLAWHEVRMLPDRIEHQGVWTTRIGVDELASAQILCPDLETPARVELRSRTGARISVAGAVWPIDKLGDMVRRVVAPYLARKISKRIFAGEQARFEEPLKWRRLRHGFSGASAGAFGVWLVAGSIMNVFRLPARLTALPIEHRAGFAVGYGVGLCITVTIAALLIRAGWKRARRFFATNGGGIVLTATGLRRTSKTARERSYAAVTEVRVDRRGMRVFVKGEGAPLSVSVSAENYVALLELLPRLVPQATWTCSPRLGRTFSPTPAPRPVRAPVARAPRQPVVTVRPVARVA